MNRMNLAKLKAIWQPLEDTTLAPNAFQPWGEPGFRQWITDHERDHYSAIDNIYGPDDFGYEHNSEGLRCDELQPSESDDLRIVFTGCSFTYGVGLPVEHTFAHRLVTRLRKEGLSVPHWNLGFGGTSIDYSVRVLYQFLPRLKPDLVVAYFPNDERREVFAESKVHRSPAMINYLPDWPLPHFNTKAIDRHFTEENVGYQVSSAYAFFDTLMIAHGCEYRWDNWRYRDPIEEHHIATLPPNFASRRLSFNRKSFDAKPFARDLMHWGPNAHVSMAGTIYESIPELVAKGHERKAGRG